MKTHILRLEPNDDLISARDKMIWSQAGRILLVWPESVNENSRLLTRKLDLVLLLRRSLELGAQLALVTRDPKVRAHAAELGIPVYKKLRHAQHAQWRGANRLRQSQLRWKANRPIIAAAAAADAATVTTGVEAIVDSTQAEGSQRGRMPPRPRTEDRPLSPSVRLGFFTLGVLALLSIAALLAPGARISLTPQVMTQEVSIPVRTGAAIERVELAGELPWHFITVTVEGRRQAAVTGTIRWPESYAEGRVRFTNLTEENVIIPAGSQVLTLDSPPVRFTVIRQATLPRGVGQTISLPVKALAPGTQGNQPAGSLKAIEGILGTRVIADNPEAIQGGSDRTVPAPGQPDRERLHQELLDALRSAALQEIDAALDPGDQPLEGSLRIQQVIEESYEPALSQPADELSLTLRVEFSALYVDEDDLEELATYTLNAALPPGFAPLPGTLEIDLHALEQQAGTVEEQGILRASSRFAREIQAEIQPDQVVQIALGLSPRQARQRLSSALPLQSPPRITLIPFWWPRLPVLAFRIQVERQP